MNIGPRQQRLRLIGGFVMLPATLLLMAALVFVDAPRAWRAVIVVPVALTAVLFLQVRARTCVALAAQGLCHLDRQVARVNDPDQLRAMRQDARRIGVHSALTAAVVTAVFVVVP